MKKGVGFTLLFEQLSKELFSYIFTAVIITLRTMAVAIRVLEMFMAMGLLIICRMRTFVLMG